jgi:hypothetical protein
MHTLITRERVGGEGSGRHQPPLPFSTPLAGLTPFLFFSLGSRLPTSLCKGGLVQVADVSALVNLSFVFAPSAPER